MSSGWTLSVDRDALHFLLGLSGRDRTKLLDQFNALIRDSHQPCNFVESSPNRRDYNVKVMGRFAVTYWLDPEKIVRVVRIDRVKGS